MDIPLAVDIDGTLTRPDGTLDPRVIDPLREWEGLVVVTTGKVLPNSLSLCDYIGIPRCTVSENGGIVFAKGELSINSDGDAPRRVLEEYIEEGFDPGWGEVDLVNKWRETEVAVNTDSPKQPLERIASEHGLMVVDTKYAYHVKSPHVDKGSGLLSVCDLLDRDVEEFVAIGDSENDAPTFRVVGESYALSNSDEKAKSEADFVVDQGFADGFLEVLDSLDT